MTPQDRNPDLDLNWALLEAISADVRAQVESLLSRAAAGEFALSWGFLIERAVRNKVLPLLAATVLDRDDVAIPLPISKHLRSSWELNRYRLARLRAAAHEVQERFDQQGIANCLTKGLSLDRKFYPGGTRVMNDIDFMVHPDAARAAEETLSDLGFAAGEINFATGKVEPHSRRELVFYRLNPDHVPIMTRTTGDPLVPTIRVDVAYNMTWFGSDWEYGVAEAIAERQVISADGPRLYGMLHSQRFLHTAIHLFREAWLSRWLPTGQDVNLAKFADILRIWSVEGDDIRDEVVTLVARHDIEAMIAFVTEHTDAVFGSGLTADLGLAGKADDLRNTGVDSRGNRQEWQGDMRDRLRMLDRTALYGPAR